MQNKVEGVDSIPSQITDDYDMQKTIGTGHFGKARSTEPRQTCSELTHHTAPLAPPIPPLHR